MLSLPKLHQQYKKQHPQYHDPLARYSPEDQELEKIKRTALSPYLQRLEEQMIIFKDIITIFAVLYDVVVEDFGFSAEVWRLQPIHVPIYAEHLSERNSWIIGCGWSQLRLLQDRINCMPWGWTFWPEKRVVQSVEDSFIHGGCLAAHNALRNTVNL